MLDLLFDQKFDAYFAAFRKNAPLWVFVHVPKTAGSSLRGELAGALRPEANIFVDYNDPSKTYMESLDDAVRAFIQRHRETPHRFASGHIFPQHVDMIERAAGEIRRITMLRQPAKRVISDYRYQCSPMHPGFEAFRERFPTIHDYLRQDEEANKATRYLVPYTLFQAGDVDACVDFIVRTYDFLGLQEMYPLSFRLLFALIGERRFPTLRVRVNEGGEDAELANDPAIIAAVEERNALDIAVHRALLARWRPVRDPMIEYLGTLPATAEQRG